LHMDT